jgi:hypothetical protein
MAGPCIISYGGKDYSYDEFAAMLHDGLLGRLIESGAVKGLGGAMQFSSAGGRDESARTRGKALLNRAFEGAPDIELKEKIKALGLDYEIQSYETARKAAKEFVDQVGFYKAKDAVHKNMIDGGTAAFVWAELIDQINAEVANAQDTEDVDILQDIQRELLNEFDQRAREKGRFISALREVYQGSDFNYQVERQVQKYKDNNKNGVIPPEVEQKIKDLKEQLDAADKKIKQAERQAEKVKAQAAIGDIQESIDREAKKKPEVTIKEKTKVIADKIRSGKTTRPGIFMSQTPGALAWNGALEVAAKTVEASGTAAEAIVKGLNYISNTDWYKNLTSQDKAAADAAFTDHIKKSTKKEPEISVVDGVIKIPHSIIRKYVENGATDIDELTQAIKEDMIEEYPDITDRQIRDAVTKYGQVVNPNPEVIEAEIRKMKRIGRITSAMEDIAEKKRPLKSGAQRDAIEVEERKLMKELKAALAELPVDADAESNQLKTALDAVKARLNNQISDLTEEINSGIKAAKARGVEYDQEANDLMAERDRIKAIRDELFADPDGDMARKIERTERALERAIEDIRNRIARGDIGISKPDRVTSPMIEQFRSVMAVYREHLKSLRDAAGITEEQRVKSAKAAAARRIAELQDRINRKDFSKKVKKAPVVADQELLALRAEKLRVQEEFDTLQYKNELANRSRAQKVLDVLGEIWGLTRALRATGEFSFIMIQMGKQVLAHPVNAAKAFKTMFTHMFSQERTEEWERNLKLQDFYPELKASKLAITENNIKLSVREEAFINSWVSHIWDYIGYPLKLASPKAWDAWKAFNPTRFVERAGTMFMNQMRLERFLQGREMLKAQGKTIETHPDAYKNMADVINTLTGRATIGSAEMLAPKLSILFFSPRMWASQIKTSTPYAFIWLAQKGDKGTYKPSVAQKMAIGDMMKWMASTGAMVAFTKLAWDALHDDDDEKDQLTVEMDPTSSNFMKIKCGNIVVDPWAGSAQQVTFFARMFYGTIKKASGEILPLGLPYKTSTRMELMITQIRNKMSPSAGLAYNALDARLKGKRGEYVKTDKFGQPYSLEDELIASTYPIFWDTIIDLHEDQPVTVQAFLDFLAFIGYGVQVQEDKKKKQAEEKGTGTEPGAGKSMEIGGEKSGGDEPGAGKSMEVGAGK